MYIINSWLETSLSWFTHPHIVQMSGFVAILVLEIHGSRMKIAFCRPLTDRCRTTMSCHLSGRKSTGLLVSPHVASVSSQLNGGLDQRVEWGKATDLRLRPRLRPTIFRQQLLTLSLVWCKEPSRSPWTTMCLTQEQTKCIGLYIFYKLDWVGVLRRIVWFHFITCKVPCQKCWNWIMAYIVLL